MGSPSSQKQQEGDDHPLESSIDSAILLYMEMALCIIRILLTANRQLMNIDGICEEGDLVTVYGLVKNPLHNGKVAQVLEGDCGQKAAVSQSNC